MEWFRSIDASVTGEWLLSHSASAAGKAGAAFFGALLAIVVVGGLVLCVNAVAFVAAARRREWPRGHAKWAWLVAIPSAFVVSVAIPGFFVWLGLVVPLAYWIMLSRSRVSAETDGR